MPELTRGTARIHYDDLGSGDLVIMVHGLAENSLYWHVTGIAGRLSADHRIAVMDMRGHGRTHESDAHPGYDDVTIGEDILALADHLGVERFHLVSHATGGMAAVRLAVRDDSRIMSLTLTDTGAATWPGREDPREAMAPRFEGRSWDDIAAGQHRQPGLFLSQLDLHPDRVRLWELFEQMERLGHPDRLARFIRTFFDDPDPNVTGLGKIGCPTLIFLGEADRLFIRPSQLMADTIPGAEHVVLPGVGHMTALEAPDPTFAAIHQFIVRHSRSDAHSG